MNKSPNLIKSSISSKNFFVALLIFVAIFAVLTYILVQYDAFDEFYYYTRDHEDWELDEIILGVFAFFISLSFALFYLSFTFGRKVVEFTKNELEQQKSLQVNQKLKSMGSMLGGLAHSLNNHLVPIITISKMIKEDTPKDSETREDIEKVLEASYSLRDILKQVLSYTRMDNKSITNSCNIYETITSTLNLAKTTIPSNIKFETSIENTDAIIPISRINIEIIIFNLISNSIHALENRQKGSIKFKFEVKEQIAFIVVKDNGSGIGKDKIDLIFDPFYTTKEQGKGTGLGLSETFGIIKKAGGKIEVDSQEDVYTQFKIEIPIIKEYEDEKSITN